MPTKAPIFALVDCDNFFVSCERVFRPHLWHKPVVALSNNDGCIVARSNEVKAMGIPMGVPYFKVASLLEAQGVVRFSGNFALYGDFSRRVVQLLEEASPRVEVYSVDESFLEISGLAIFNYEEWAIALRHRIGKLLGIPVSIGVAPTKTLAKAAAERAKKDAALGGVCCIIADEKRHQALLKATPLQDVWGVGRRTAPKLQNRGVKTAYDLSLVSDAWARQQLTIRGLDTVLELRGQVRHQIAADSEPQQTLAVTRTFSHRVYAYHELEGRVASLAARGAQKLRRSGQIAAALAIFIAGDRHRDGDKYRRVSTLVPLLQPANDTSTLLEAALQGLATLYDQEFAYRRAGVILLDLTSEEARQLSWLAPQKGEELEKRNRLMQAIDGLNAKYHTQLVHHAVEPYKSKTSFGAHRGAAFTTSWHQLPSVRV